MSDKKIKIETSQVELKTRIVKVSDSAEIARLSTELGHKISSKEAQYNLKGILKDPSQDIIVIEHVGVRLLGFVYIFTMAELYSGVQGRIWGLIVDQNAQGMGIGTRLVAEAEKLAKKKGCTSMKVNSNVMRTGAHKFYEKVGYVKYKEQAIFKKSL